MDAILAEARAERLFPGEGGVDLLGLLRAMPRDIPLSLEVPTHHAGQDRRCHRARTPRAGRDQARARATRR